MRKVTIVTEYFGLDDSATGKLMSQLASRLVHQFKVQVITGKSVRQETPSAGNISSSDDHVAVVRLPSTRLQKQHFALRLLDWFTFIVLASIRLLFTDRKAVLLVLTNPPTLPVVGLILKALRKQPFILVIHDVYPDIAIELGVVRDGLITRMWKAINGWVYAAADKIVVLSSTMKEAVERQTQFGANVNSKILVIPNWEDPNFIVPIEKAANPFSQQHGYTSKLTIVYSGNLGLQHDLMTLLHAAKGLTDYPLKFVIIGDGAQRGRLMKYVRDHKLPNVDFHPYQPSEKVPTTLTCGDVLVVTTDARVKGLCVSSKLYSSMAAGRAILAISPRDTEVATTVNRARCGFVTAPGDDDAVIKHVISWLAHPKSVAAMGSRARSHFESFYTIDRAVKAYAEVLNHCLPN